MTDIEEPLQPGPDGLIRLFPRVVGTFTDDPDQWTVRCPFCEHVHRHSSWPGEAVAHCLEDSYVIYPENLRITDYDLRGYCMTCRDDYLANTHDYAANALRLRPYAPTDLTPSDRGLFATYVCNFSHWWQRLSPFNWPPAAAPVLPNIQAVELPYPTYLRPRRTTSTARRVALYWHYDEAGVLLYIGITDGLSKRGKDHARYSPWVEFATHVRAVWLDSRPEAEHAERRAIVTENPIFNVKDADGGADAQAVRVEMYLRSKGILV
jgi:hypothetical protein